LNVETYSDGLIMKVLVADKIAASGVAYLRQQEGIEVVEAYGSSEDTLCALSKDVDAIIVRSASDVTRKIMEAAPQLKAIGRAGVGVDNIDVEAATERGVIVLNTPAGNTIATAELAFTHLLCSARPIPQACASMRENKWDKKSFEGTELLNKTLGILGLGRIGTEVAKRALAFGMNVLAYDPYLTQERARALDVKKVDFEELIQNADFITVHMPKTEETNHLINKAALAQMKKGVRIVNCARGGIIQEDDLLEALQSGKVAYAGLDVFETEPLAKDSPLRQQKNLVLTPHLGASTVEAQENVGLEVAVEIVAALTGGMVRNAVNMPALDPAALKLLKPFIHLGHQLGALVQQITPDEVQKLTITYWGRLTELDMMAVTRAIQKGYLSRISEHVNDVNAPHHMKNKGIEVQVIKSSADREYNDLISVEALEPNGNRHVLEGTVIGKSQQPRLVHINGREVEGLLSGCIMLIENEDVRGVVGLIGTSLAKHGVNIANMSLSRNAVGGLALNVVELDSRPSDACLTELRSHKPVKNVYMVEL
jgi:D-3-phosphoglycerate dehydrogenase